MHLMAQINSPSNTATVTRNTHLCYVYENQYQWLQIILTEMRESVPDAASIPDAAWPYIPSSVKYPIKDVYLKKFHHDTFLSTY